MKKEDETGHCSGCGLLIGNGTTGCRAIFDEVLEREFTNVAYFSVHRMTVDTYCLQHPEQFCVSAKSFAAHLTGLCWTLEFGGDRVRGSERLRLWLEKSPILEKPEIPLFRGKMTILDVHRARSVTGHILAVERWAKCTWEAFRDLHPLAKRWIEEALNRTNRNHEQSR